MKNWWLELYTIPALKNLGKSFLVVFSFNFLLGFFFPDYIFLGIYANFYPFRSLKVQRNKSFAGNIEFHKLHVPFVELRKAFFIDFFIQFIFMNISFMISFAIVIHFQKQINAEMPLMIYPFLFLMSFIPLWNIGGLPKGGKYEYNLLDPDIGKIKHLMISFLCGIFLFVSYFFAVLFKFSPVSYGFFAAVLVLVGHFWFLIKAVFHQEMKKGTFAVFIKYTFKGFAVSVCSFLLVSFATRPLIHVSSIDPEWRNLLFLFSGPLSPELNFEEAKQLIATDESDIGLILSKTPGIEHLPVSELFKNPSSYHFYKYVSSIHPSSENMLYILEKIHQSKKPAVHDYATSKIIVKKWPLSSKFPEHLLVKKMKKEDLTVSERLPAGK